MRTPSWVAWSVVTAAVLLSAPSARAGLVTLHSGNGSIGGNDSQIRMLVGPGNGPFTAAFTGADFTSADTGPLAFIIPRNTSGWIASLSTNSAAQWIGTNANAEGYGPSGGGHSALYAIDFVLLSTFTTATLAFDGSADNTIGTVGGTPNQGIYINGTAISGSSSSTGDQNGGELKLTRNDIGPLLHLGTNTLYVYNANTTEGADTYATYGNPAGLLFSATITTNETAAAVPEPSSLAMVMGGAFCLIGYAWRPWKGKLFTAAAPVPGPGQDGVQVL